jgi:hypothetical protein
MLGQTFQTETGVGSIQADIANENVAVVVVVVVVGKPKLVLPLKYRFLFLFIFYEYCIFSLLYISKQILVGGRNNILTPSRVGHNSFSDPCFSPPLSY